MSVASSAAVGPPPGMKVRLSSNESPFGPSPAAIEAATAALADAHLYPDDQSIALRAALTTHLGRAEGEVAVGTGSAALLMDAIPHACADGPPTDTPEVLAFARSFVVYRLAARNAGAAYVEVETGGPASGETDGYARDAEAMLAALTDDTRVVVVDNPGNPTGAHLTGEELTTLIEGVPAHVTVIVDEAYHEFAAGQRGYATVRELDVAHPKLLVLRTFSKAYALAALRVGSIAGPVDLITALDARRTRFNVTATAQAAALVALEDTDHLARTVEGTIEGRGRMAAGLRELGIPFTDGLGNFLTIELGTAAAPVVEAYAGFGVGVRPLAPYGMDEQLRVSVGTPAEVNTFLEASRTVLADVPTRR
ncbi:MAG: aminotransferase class I/II-fold pyridoxal phosphate-dependent enzyme [Nitriliruptoraceae bacterium]|nr:aminotransferase class I/II-fold pyridoxal phosphate-dependent enzyme [Nitriliruptoraceae bacterium]